MRGSWTPSMTVVVEKDRAKATFVLIRAVAILGLPSSSTGNMVEGAYHMITPHNYIC